MLGFRGHILVFMSSEFRVEGISWAWGVFFLFFFFFSPSWGCRFDIDETPACGGNRGAERITDTILEAP